jgi:hypothetical protein
MSDSFECFKADALRMRHRNRQSVSSHAVKEQAETVKHFDLAQPRLELLAAIGGETRPGLGDRDPDSCRS